MAKGVYSRLGESIRDKRLISPVIDARAMAEEFDISWIPREDLERDLKAFYVAVALNACGFRSVIKNEGLYVDVKQVKKGVIAEKLLGNINTDIDSRERLIDSINKLISNNDVNLNQLEFDTSTTCLKILDNATEEEIIDILSRIAV